MGNSGKWKYITPGIPDDSFYRENVPLTKQEIRVLTLSRLRLEPGLRVLDVGAGAGSISVECGLLMENGMVYAVEHNGEAVETIKKNVRLFGLENVNIIHGSAPQALQETGQVDRVVIGGTGGKMEAVLKESYDRLISGGILVVNCILLESLYSSMDCLKRMGSDTPEILSVSISRGHGLGLGTMMKPLNPTFIVAASKRQVVD